MICVTFLPEKLDTVNILCYTGYSLCCSSLLPSVLWHCWLGGRKVIRPVKMGGWWRWALV